MVARGFALAFGNFRTLTPLCPIFYSYNNCVDSETGLRKSTGHTLVVPAVLRASDFTRRTWVRFPLEIRLIFFFSGLSVLIAMGSTPFGKNSSSGWL
jgi:hypothetical protein